MIEIEEEKEVAELVKKVFYSHMGVHYFNGKSDNINTPKHQFKASKDQSVSTKTNNYSSKEFYAELEVEINRNQQAQIEHIRSQYDKRVHSLKQQLLFKIKNLFQTSSDGSIRFKTELLKTTDKDYQFILRSITDDSCNANSKVLHIFRINPIDQIQVNKLKYTDLYLHGIKSNKIIDVLSSGYPSDTESLLKKCNDKCFNVELSKSPCSCKIVSNDLKKEILKGTSYCNVENEVGKMSFVFVVGGKGVNVFIVQKLINCNILKPQIKEDVPLLLVLLLILNFTSLDISMAWYQLI